MGDKSSLVIVNGTPHTWQLTYIHSYQLTQWDATFPRSIPPFASVAVAVQRSDAIFRDRTQDGGEASYTVLTNSGTQPALQFQARADGGQTFRLQAVLQNFAAQPHPLGSTVPIGWVVDGQTNFVLAGTQTSGVGFVCNGLPENWMRASLAQLGGRTLRQLCMLGSHDAGINQRNAGTTGAFDCNILTQTASIGAQLSAGVRYFDLRPVISAGQFSTGHYSLIEIAGNKTWQGANGQSFASIVADINAYTARCPELIILNVSHELNTDLGNASYAAFTQAEWDRFLGMLQSSLNNLYIAPGGTSVDLSSQTLQTFIGSGRAAVLIMFAPSDGSKVLSPQFAGRGFYLYRQLNAYDHYSNTNDLAAMTNDQLTKMRTQRPSPNNAFFLLSWTLTQNATQAATCFLGTASSILELADKANPTLFTTLFPACTSSCFPNVLYIDSCTNAPYGTLVMAINNLLGGGKITPSADVAGDVLSVYAEHRAAKEAAKAFVPNASSSVVIEHKGSMAGQVRMDNTTPIKRVDEHRARIADLRSRAQDSLVRKR